MLLGLTAGGQPAVGATVPRLTPDELRKNFHLTAEGCEYVFSPVDGTLTLQVAGTNGPVLRGLGPVWEVAGQRCSPLTNTIRLTGCERTPAGRRYTYVGSPGEVRWQIELRAGVEREVEIRLESEDQRIVQAQAGSIITGEWTALNLSQYQLAYGQPHWPKTFYLPDPDLFLCAWWDWERSQAVAEHWLPAHSEPVRGKGEFRPAAAMVYARGPDKQRATLREVLHVRAARSLWDAALPSLCQPSEYARELAGMVFLDVWGGGSAAQLKHTLTVFERLVGPQVRLLTIAQNWQAGGFDALLPDSIWLPEYPPSPAVGTVAELREVADLGGRLGRFGFRTDYLLLHSNAPSMARRKTDFAVRMDGKPAWFTQSRTWLDLARRQETEIAELWRPRASFTDQLASGGRPWAYQDFSAPEKAEHTLAAALRHQRELARFIKETHAGPLGSETLIQQDLVGYYCDFGDFGIMDGHDRLFLPDYKLRRMHELTTFYGCGLSYRFFEMLPFKLYHASKLNLWADPALMDDYRCCEVMFGNAGYLCWPTPWTWALTECVVVGRLQRHYALVPVAAVDYLVAGQWQSLESLVRSGFAPAVRPWNQKQTELGRVRVRYANGLTVWVNRLAEELPVATPQGAFVLPQYGWLAYRSDEVLAYSAFWPGTRQRVDFLDEQSSGLRFLNSRGAVIEGSDRMRLWQHGQLLWSVSPKDKKADIGGVELALEFPAPAPLAEVQFDFRQGLGGWRPASGVLRVEPVSEGTRLIIVTTNPQLVSPALNLAGRAGDVLELSLSAAAGTAGKLFFATTKDGISERQVVRFAVPPDGQVHTIRIPVGKHAGWRESPVTLLRLDPVYGPEHSAVTLVALRLKRAD